MIGIIFSALVLIVFFMVATGAGRDVSGDLGEGFRCGTSIWYGFVHW